MKPAACWFVACSQPAQVAFWIKSSSLSWEKAQAPKKTRECFMDTRVTSYHLSTEN